MHSRWGVRSRVRRKPATLTFEQLEPRLAMAVVINEFLAANDSGLMDVAGDRPDWIELKNAGAVAENIGGWYLTDDSTNLAKWQIPAGTTINPGDHLVIFASGKDLTGSELHTNFALEKNGEDLALVMPDGTTVADSYFAFPAQEDDVSYGIGASASATSNVTLVGASSSLRVISPTGEDAAVDDHWREIGFNDSTWLTGTRSVGFDRNTDGVNLLPFIGRVLTTGEMDSLAVTSNSDPANQYSAYVRYAFNVTDKDQLTSLTLDLRFDDGFIAYINGREVKRVNFGEDFVRPQPQWNSTSGNHVQGSSATVVNRVAESTGVVTFDLTPYLPELVNGTNVVAFHGVNSNSTSSSHTNRLDFLIEPVLTATRATSMVVDSFMVGPTPGGDNGVGVLGFVADTQFSHDRGFYDAAFNLEITTATPGATIRYTTDGSLPTLTNGTTYTGPIAIDPATIPNGERGVVMIRAAAFKEGFAPTNVDTQSYLFLDKVIFQDGSGLPASGPWGHDKDDDEGELLPEYNGYQLDHDDKDWEIDPDIRNAVGTAQLIEDLKSIPSMSIVMDWDDLFSATPLPGTPPQTGTEPGGTVAPSPEGIYIVGRSEERYSSLEYFNPDSPDDQFQVDAAIEIQGHSSPTRWNTDKLSFQVKFKFPYGETELNHPLFVGTPSGESATSEFDTLILDAGFNYTWTHSNLTVQTNFARYVSDQVVADLQNLASGGDVAAHGKYVHLYLNGIYWGLYNVHERPDDSFAAEYYGGNKDDYYVVKHSTNEVAPPAGHKYTWVEGGITAENTYQVLVDATRLVSEDPTNAALYEAVADMLDVDQFIDYMIVHMYAGNKNDWPHNNWYATLNYINPNGTWRFHSWDQEHAFPTNDNTDSFTQFVDLTDFDPDDDDAESPGEVFHNLIENPEFRLRFADRVQELMYNGGVLTESIAQDVYEARLAEIDRAINGESARWGDNRNAEDPFTRQDWLDVNLNNLTGDLKAVVPDFFPVRTSTVLQQFNAVNEEIDKTDWIPSLDAPLFSQYGGEITSGYDLAITKPGGSPGGAVIYYTLDGSDPRDPTTNLASGSALLYSGTVDLAESTRVKARIFFNNAGDEDDWSPLVDKTFFVDVQDRYPLRIVELMYNPAGTSDEYIELTNTSDATINLAGVKITEFSTNGYTFTSGSLDPGERIVVVRNQAAFAAAYPGVTNVASGEFSGSLANEGEFVALRGPLDELIQHFEYDDNDPWPADPDGSGYSLVYVGPFDADAEDPMTTGGDPYDDPANWRRSALGGLMGGSPGADEPPPIPGDYDGNRVVDVEDYAMWKSQYGMLVEPGTESDGNGDGRIDAGDYVFWRNRLGAMGGGGLAATSSVVDAAPERPSATLAFVADGTQVTRLDQPLAIGDRAPAAESSNDLLWLALEHAASNAASDDPVDAIVTADGKDEVESVALLWEDDAWLVRLGRS